jgi:hypothetical protein
MQADSERHFFQNLATSFRAATVRDRLPDRPRRSSGAWRHLAIQPQTPDGRTFDDFVTLDLRDSSDRSAAAPLTRAPITSRR